MRRWLPAPRAFKSLECSGRRALSCSRALQNTERKAIAELLRGYAGGEPVEVCGWVKNVRKQKRVAFLEISDGHSLLPLQAVISPKQAEDISTGQAISLIGSWKSSQGAGQSKELNDISEVRILGNHDAEHSPIQPKYQTQEYLRSIPHLRGRVTSNAAVLRLRSQLIASITDFFNKSGYVQTHTPIITSSDCEGAGEVFTVSSNAAKDSEQQLIPQAGAKVEHFFKQPKYLTVSAQLHLEALAQAIDRVWTLSPTFRAEKSDTPRHLSEFYMLEAELCFTKDLDSVTSLVEDMLRTAANDLVGSGMLDQLKQVRQRAVSEATDDDASSVTPEALQIRWDGMRAQSWPRITYHDAWHMLAREADAGKVSFEPKLKYDDGFSAEQERCIANLLGRGKPVFVTDYPRSQKPFYMAPSDPTLTASDATTGSRTSETVACFDLLVPDLCELAGGSLREHNLDALRKGMAERRVSGENLEWYEELRKYGSVPHGGFGLGFDRLLCYLSGYGNVRDVVAFPRWHEHAQC